MKKITSLLLAGLLLALPTWTSTAGAAETHGPGLQSAASRSPAHGGKAKAHGKKHKQTHKNKKGRAGKA